MSIPAYTVADYLIDRLAAAGAGHLFQVPGNYTAQFLTRAQNSGKIECIGTINELEAGYAADAYARLRPPGVVCTTYGVGSFSLYNAIAGSFVERCPVVLINGSANADKARALVRRNVLFAHAIDTIRTDEQIFKPITAATAVIVDPEEAPRQIDRVLRACVTEKKPVYLEVRDGVWLKACARPSRPLRLVPSPLPQENENDRQVAARAAAARTFEALAKAQHPVLWGGEELQRYGLENRFEELVARSELPYTTTLLGKSLLAEAESAKSRERRPGFLGVYDSKFAPAAVRTVVENSDCVLAVGTILSDFYGDIVEKQSERMILAAGGAVRVGSERYPGVELSRFLDELLALFRQPSEPMSAHTPPRGFDQLAVPARGLRPPALAGEAPEETKPDGMTWVEAFGPIHDFVDEETFVIVDITSARKYLTYQWRRRTGRIGAESSCEYGPAV